MNMKRVTRFMQAVSLALTALSAGCATPGAQVGPTPTQPGDDPSARMAELQGQWRGSFDQIATMGDSRRIHGDIECKINGDGTYKTVWITGLVAGSSRGGRMEMTGTIIVRRNSVTFVNSDGWQTTMKRDGDTLYAVAMDPAGRRANVALDLHKVREGR